jgi:hypothetical protein
MTQPHIIGPGAKARSATDKLISSLLTVLLEELGNGASRDQVMDLVGVELNEPRVDLARMRLLAACAVSRLARMHHAAEQLIDLWTQMAAALPMAPDVPGDTVSPAERQAAVEAIQECVEGLRKLVDDHG